MNYFLRIGSENQGPFTIDDLRKRGVAANDYVWRDGLADWQPAGGLPELVGVVQRPQATMKSVYAGDPTSPYAPPVSSNYGDELQTRQPLGSLKQSGFGIASTILGVGTVAGVFAGLMIIGLMQQNGANAREPTPALIAMSLGICFGGPLVHLFGLILGIVGIFQHQRSKLFGILGTVINGLVVLAFLAMILIGVLIGMSVGN